MVKEQKLRFFKRSPEISFLTLNPLKKNENKKNILNLMSPRLR